MPAVSGSIVGGATGNEDEAGRVSMEGIPQSEAGTSSGSGSSATVSASGGIKREVGADRPKMTQEGAAAGPKKTKVVVRDAAWSTWWAVLFWVS